MQTVQRNPIHDYLERQQREVTERISSTKSEIEKIRKVTRRLERSLFYRSVYGIDPNPDSDDDIYTASGYPVQLQRPPQKEQRDILTAVKCWQQIIDDKWVLGVVLRNVSKETLHDLDFFVCLKNKSHVAGISTIWKQSSSEIARAVRVGWTKTKSIEPYESEYDDEIVATYAMELPTFEKESRVEAFATVCYRLNDEELQLPIVPNFKLSLELATGSNDSKSQHNSEYGALAKLAISEKTIEIPEVDMSENLSLILKQSKFQDCVQPLSDIPLRIQIVARSSKQLGLMEKLLRKKISENTLSSQDQISVNVAALALEKELLTYLEEHQPASSRVELARVRSDVLIP